MALICSMSPCRCRNMISTAITLIFLLSILHQECASLNIKKESHSIKKRAEITADQVQCISKYITDALDTNDIDCLSVVAQLGALYDSSDIATSISSGVRFSELCLPSCGQVIIDSWQSCNAYSEIEDVANLLIGMCALNGDSPCYTYYDELFEYFYNGASCYELINSTGQCSSECASGTRSGVESYGCCVNVPIQYELSYQNFTEAEVNKVFSACEVSRPASCTNSPLMTPSAASQVAFFTAAAYICLSTIVAFI